MNRADYMSGAVDHQTYYLALADVIGRAGLEQIVSWVAPLEKLRAALESEKHLSAIPLGKWDACDPGVRSMVARNAAAVMAVSWSGHDFGNPRAYCWSLCETVCVLKAVAVRMVEESKAVQS